MAARTITSIRVDMNDERDYARLQVTESGQTIGDARDIYYLDRDQFNELRRQVESITFA